MEEKYDDGVGDKRNEIPKGKGNKVLGGGNGMNGMEKSKEGKDHCDG